MKRLVLVLTEMEAKALDLAIGNSLDSRPDAEDIFNTTAGPVEKQALRAAYRARFKLHEAIRGAMPAGAVVFTGAERDAAQSALAAQDAGGVDGVEEETREWNRLTNATGTAIQKMPDGAFMAIPMQAPKAKP